MNGKIKKRIPKTYMVLDYETYSECSLEDAGAYEYSMHPTTEVLCVAWRIGTKETLRSAPTGILTPNDWKSKALDTPFIQALLNPQVQLVAHNAFFEECITQNVVTRITNLLGAGTLARKVTLDRWVCTASRARACGLPGGLEELAVALDLEHKKNMDGHRVMLKLAKPRKPTKFNPSTRHDDKDDYGKLYQYCVDDIATEVDAFLALPALSRRCRELWELDQVMNMRGFAVDREHVLNCLYLIDRELRRLDSTMRKLTGGAVENPRKRKELLDYVNRFGVDLQNTQAATVKETLAREGLHPKAREVLEVLALASRSSTSKYIKFDIRSRSDGRARDNLIWHGAHTGRSNGTGLQPLNLFKRVMSQADVEAGLKLIAMRDHHAIAALYDRPMDLYASTLRSTIVAAPGHVFDVGDFNAIEVRVLFWIADHAEGLRALRDGVDLYIDMAADIYKQKAKRLARLYKAGDDGAVKMRQLGKSTVLGAGFGIGIGGEKFQAACKQQYGIDVSLTLASNAVRGYREKHKPVPKFWRVIEESAIRAVRSPGKTIRHGRLAWRYDGTFLRCRLPSGRCLHYYKPRMVLEKIKPNSRKSLYGPRQVLSFLTSDNITRRLTRETTWGGKLTENVVQAIAADLLQDALLRLEKRAVWKPVLPVHDEAVAERESDPRTDAIVNAAFRECMAEVPSWAEGLPVKVESWYGDRYKK